MVDKDWYVGRVPGSEDEDPRQLFPSSYVKIEKYVKQTLYYKLQFFTCRFQVFVS